MHMCLMHSGSNKSNLLLTNIEEEKTEQTVPISQSEEAKGLIAKVMKKIITKIFIFFFLVLNIK